MLSALVLTIVGFIILVLAAASAFVYLSMVIKKRHRFGRWQAIVLLVTYGVYVLFVVGRG